MNNQKALQIILVIAGAGLLSASLLYDPLIAQKKLSLGPLQLACVVAGVAVLALGCFLRSSGLQILYKRINSTLLTKIHFHTGQTQKRWIIDLTLLVVFLVVAFAFFAGRWKGLSPVINLGSDAANVATYAAVLDHPENFSNDFLFNNIENFSYYVSFHIPYLRVFSDSLGGYGLAYLSLLIPIILLQLTGFYFLGKAIFKDRFWAFLLAFLSLILIYTESSDYWGIYKDPQPRMLFGAFLPWLLWIAYASLHHPRLRYLAMVLAGAMLYLHPLSAPGVGFAVWLGFLLFKPQGEKTGRHLLNMLLLGLFFFALAVPFTFTYLNSRDLAPAVVDYATALEAFKTKGMAMFDLGGTLLELLKIITTTLLLPLAVIAWGVSWFKLSLKTEVKLILIWLFGLLFVGSGITIIESAIDAKLEIMPVLLQLNRGLRYVVPLLEISILLPFAACTRLLGVTNWKRLIQKVFVMAAGVGVIAVLVLGFRNITRDKLDLKGYAQQAVKCWSHGNLYCDDSNPADLLETLAFISDKTPGDAGFISIPPVKMSKLIRYQGLRSIVFESADIKTLLTSNMTEYFAIQGEVEQWKKIEEILDNGKRFQAYLEFAGQYGAEYAVVASVDADQYLTDPYSLVFSSGDYAIVAIP